MVCFTEYHSNACIFCLSPAPRFAPDCECVLFMLQTSLVWGFFNCILSSVIQGCISSNSFFALIHPDHSLSVFFIHWFWVVLIHELPFLTSPELLVIILLLSFFFRSFHFSRVVFFSCLFLFSLDLKERHSLTPLSMSLLKSYKERAREECSMYTKIVCLAHFSLL